MYIHYAIIYTQTIIKEVLQLKTEVINIGVPAEVFIDYSTSEIKELVIQAIADPRPIIVDEQPIKCLTMPKYVTMSVRLPKATTKAVRQLADENALPITMYTCKLLEGVNDNV